MGFIHETASPIAIETRSNANTVKLIACDSPGVTVHPRDQVSIEIDRDRIPDLIADLQGVIDAGTESTPTDLDQPSKLENVRKELTVYKQALTLAEYRYEKLEQEAESYRENACVWLKRADDEILRKILELEESHEAVDRIALARDKVLRELHNVTRERDEAMAALAKMNEPPKNQTMAVQLRARVTELVARATEELEPDDEVEMRISLIAGTPGEDGTPQLRGRYGIMHNTVGKGDSRKDHQTAQAAHMDFVGGCERLGVLPDDVESWVLTKGCPKWFRRQDPGVWELIVKRAGDRIAPVTASYWDLMADAAPMYTAAHYRADD